MLPSAGSQYQGIMGGKELGGAVNRATSKLTKGIAQGRKIKNAVTAVKYGELRKDATALKEARGRQAQSLMARETEKRKAAASTEMESAQINKGFRELTAQRMVEKKAGEEEHMFNKAPVTMPSKAQQLKAGGGPRRAGAPVSSAQMRGPSAPTSSTGLS